MEEAAAWEAEKAEAKHAKVHLIVYIFPSENNSNTAGACRLYCAISMLWLTLVPLGQQSRPRR